ncbi:hypothetical protein AB0C11_41995 [Streptomyces sp. NPDC039016]|uniref:hypothetical protein n=1 Tax=Streptomyces sp. NPDC039016 TaxID=3154330 RepID=UPI0034103162
MGTKSCVILRGVAGTNWKEELEKQWEKFSKYQEMVPLWQAPTLTDPEKSDLESLPEHWDRKNNLAWIGSGILRRLALLHTSVNSCTVSAWITGDEWIFELDGAPRVPLNHDLFIHRLSDPTWGLGLKVDSHYCYCHSPEYGNMYQCTYYLHPDHNGSGTLQFRFRYGALVNVKETRRTLADVNASTDWLARVLPERSDDPKGGEA